MKKIILAITILSSGIVFGQYNRNEYSEREAKLQAKNSTASYISYVTSSLLSSINNLNSIAEARTNSPEEQRRRAEIKAKRVEADFLFLESYTEGIEFFNKGEYKKAWELFLEAMNYAGVTHYGYQADYYTALRTDAFMMLMKSAYYHGEKDKTYYTGYISNYENHKKFYRKKNIQNLYAQLRKEHADIVKANIEWAIEKYNELKNKGYKREK